MDAAQSNVTAADTWLGAMDVAARNLGLTVQCEWHCPGTMVTGQYPSYSAFTDLLPRYRVSRLHGNAALLAEVNPGQAGALRLICQQHVYWRYPLSTLPADSRGH